jgi:hypothetical protein
MVESAKVRVRIDVLVERSWKARTLERKENFKGEEGVTQDRHARGEMRSIMDSQIRAQWTTTARAFTRDSLSSHPRQLFGKASLCALEGMNKYLEDVFRVVHISRRGKGLLEGDLVRF